MRKFRIEETIRHCETYRHFCVMYVFAKSQEEAEKIASERVPAGWSFCVKEV